jgi:hypothetical protein
MPEPQSKAGKDRCDVKVIIAGTRTCKDMLLLEQAVSESGFEITEIVCGESTGGEHLGLVWGERNNIPVKVFATDWERYGDTASSRRNGEMADYGEALIALWDGTSPGTRSLIAKANKRNLKVYVKGV